MKTEFSAERLAADPMIREANDILRKCVHCGFCTATCPTFLLLGDELDSPRGRIYLLKDMLENDRPASANVTKHIDRCLTCLSCTTTCPSGVDYMHLVDRGRGHIEKTYKRPWQDRMLRNLLAVVLPYEGRFRLAMNAAKLGKPLAGAMPDALMGRLKGMLAQAPQTIPPPGTASRPGVFAAQGIRKMRVAMMPGCVQPALKPEINEATVRLLNRLGVEVVVTKKSGCCGAVVQHMGKEKQALPFAKANIDAWMAEVNGEGLDAIVINASGCGTTVKDYGHMLKDDPAYAAKAATIANLTKDISEILADLEMPAPAPAPATEVKNMVIAYHSACSLQHGQKVKEAPKALLQAAGFTVKDVPESHICCGSAGTYSILQPEISQQLRQRKVENIKKTQAQALSAGNIGCITHIGQELDIPIVHTVELLDWATGGPKPRNL